MTAKAIVNGGQRIIIKRQIQDQFVFYPNKKFHMIGINGTWRMKTGRFVIYLSLAQIEQAVENIIASQRLHAEVDISSITFGG